jgi:hypothetical protein
MGTMLYPCLWFSGYGMGTIYGCKSVLIIFPCRYGTSVPVPVGIAILMWLMLSQEIFIIFVNIRCFEKII